MANPQIHTYHCICNQLAVAVFGPLQDNLTRSRDRAAICPLAPASSPPAGSAVLSSSTHVEDEAVVLKLANGFEKRYAMRCGRCDLQIGYMLDGASFGEGGSGRKDDVVYLLPGGLMGTEEMKEGKDMGKEVGIVVGPAG